MLSLTKIEDGEHWSSISDLMAGLMMIFLLIAIAYMHNIAQGQQKIKKIAVTYHEAQVALYEKLNEEFKESLIKKLFLYNFLSQIYFSKQVKLMLLQNLKTY